MIWEALALALKFLLAWFVWFMGFHACLHDGRWMRFWRFLGIAVGVYLFIGPRFSAWEDEDGEYHAAAKPAQVREQMAFVILCWGAAAWGCAAGKPEAPPVDFYEKQRRMDALMRERDAKHQSQDS